MTLAGMLDARKLPLASLAVNSMLSGVPKQGMEIVHEVQIVLSAETTQDEMLTTESLVTAADKACMVGNLLKTAGVQIRVSGTVTVSSGE